MFTAWLSREGKNSSLPDNGLAACKVKTIGTQSKPKNIVTQCQLILCSRFDSLMMSMTAQTWNCTLFLLFLEHCSVHITQLTTSNVS